jgi:CelD/BcsL family acetyltransferase involved in cellulose biosynthesis
MNAGIMEVSARNQGTDSVPTRRCEVIDDFSRLEQFSSDWERLWRADPEAEIFQSLAWARAWWQAYGPKLVLCSLVVFDVEEVIGILPLVRDGDGIFFLGTGQADYGDILCEDDRIADVLSTAMQKLLELPDWKRCVLRNLKCESRIVKHCNGQLLDGLQIVPSGECNTILLDRNPEVLVSLLGKHHTRRRLNKLRKAGTLVFRHLETKGEAQAQLGQFFQHQIRRFALVGKAPVTPEFQRFLRALVDELDLKSELRFGVLELDARPLAWHFSFQVNGKLLYYQQTFDVDAWDYSPGEVLVHQLLLYVQQNVIREFDFTRGNEPFKDRFTTHKRNICSLCIDRPGIPGKLRQMYRASAVPWRRMGNSVQLLAKRHDETFRAFRSIRLWVGGMRARTRYYQRRGRLLDWGRKTAVRLVRRTPLYKEQLGLFLRSSDGNTKSMPHSDSDVRVTKGQSEDLIDLACQDPQIVVAFELSRYRQRIKKGDMLYLVRQGCQVILAAWVSTRWPEEVLPLKSGQPALAPDLMLVYDLWVLGEVVGVCAYRELLQELSNVARDRKLTLYVGCDHDFHALYSELIHQGFEQAYQLDRDRIVRRFRVSPLRAPERRTTTAAACSPKLG